MHVNKAADRVYQYDDVHHRQCDVPQMRVMERRGVLRFVGKDQRDHVDAQAIRLNEREEAKEGKFEIAHYSGRLK